jgi:integrase
MLTDIQAKKAKPKDKIYRLFDGGGLYLEINPNGGKYWRLKYRFLGRERRMALGVYPVVGLTDARDALLEARQLLKKGIDPAMHRQKAVATSQEAARNTFEEIAREWINKFSHKWEPSHKDHISSRLERNIYPWFRGRPIQDITAQELLKCIRRVENRGTLETAHRVLQNCGQVFRYAIATGRAGHDITADLRGALPPTNEKHMPSITDPIGVGELMRAINGYSGLLITQCALKLAPLVFVRPGELRKAEWKEFNLDEREWRIAAERMKMRVQHIVPLSKQALAILQELKPVTGDRKNVKYVFPGGRSNGRPMSENTINAALRTLGYSKEQMTGHGFRSTASTLLNESGLWSRDAIERQLAHGERDSVRSAYNYAELLPERRRMMQWWADHLDELATKKK